MPRVGIVQAKRYRQPRQEITRRKDFLIVPSLEDCASLAAQQGEQERSARLRLDNQNRQIRSPLVTAAEAWASPLVDSRAHTEA
jgi:hypothetical protein